MTMTMPNMNVNMNKTTDIAAIPITMRKRTTRATMELKIKTT
jgi:hypothetical protein